MPGRFQHFVRLMWRGAWLAAEFAFAAATWAARGLRSRADDFGWRARWLQRHSRRMLRVLHVQLTVQGQPVPRGFLVANHLSYLDVLVLSASGPCVFVAKSEVRGWPVFGWFARMAGTVFVNRRSRADTQVVAEAMTRVEARGSLVVLFAEGTSSAGADVLPFKSSLLEPIVNAPRCGVALLRYSLQQGSVADEVCYWRDMTLVPHLLNLLTKDTISAEARFGTVDPRGMDRKALAIHLRQAVKALGSFQSQPAGVGWEGFSQPKFAL